MMSACSSVSVFMWWVWRHVGINHWKILTRPKTLLFFFFIIISFVHPLSLVKPRVESVWVLKFKNLCLRPSKGCEHEKNSEHIEHIIKYICHVFDRTFFYVNIVVVKQTKYFILGSSHCVLLGKDFLSSNSSKVTLLQVGFWLHSSF